jgi:hypothetical protein
MIAFVIGACTQVPMPDPSPVHDPTETLSPGVPVTSPPEDGSPPRTPEMPFAPQPGDADLTGGEVFLNQTELLIRESFPPQIALTLRGDLPTPCHQLRVDVQEPDAENKIEIDLYSVFDPDEVCAQVLEPFDESIELGTFPSGHYTVWVKGEMVGEFDS